MRELYVIDTCALIAFFDAAFAGAEGYDGSPVLSPRVVNLISEAIYSSFTKIRLSIPTVVFVEIYEKWLRSEEFCRKFFYDVFVPLQKSENIEIRPTDREVLERLLEIRGELEEHDLHDRLVLASAMALGAPLITTDERVTAYVNEKGVAPGVLR